MISMTKYKELMGSVEITGEMRRRVLENVRAAAPERNSKIVVFSARKKIMAAAACLAIVIIGAALLPRFIGNSAGPSNQISNGIVECASAEALSSAVGFDAPEADSLPFEPENTQYFSYWGSMAEVVYAGAENSATLRKSVGSDDVSGDYNSYASTADIAVGNISAEIKGDLSDAYTLAVWTDGVYSYSLSLDEGVSQTEWREIISAVN